MSSMASWEASLVEIPKVAIPPVNEPYSPIRISDELPSFEQQARARASAAATPAAPKMRSLMLFDLLSFSGIDETAYSFLPHGAKSKHPFCQWLKLESWVECRERRIFINDPRAPVGEPDSPPPVPAEPPPRIRPRAEHPISRARIDPDALKVLYRLRAAGHRGYLVGGSVRDLMLGRVPKDFDIGTDAHPQALRKLFRNCRLIGRRFRLAHILFANGKVIEVATFRRRSETAAQGASGGDVLQPSDNTCGTPGEDAFRRDFTINGLFYDIADFSVVDFVGGLEDLEAGLVRTIGDPDVRFQEDPVRMMRAVEFASRLGFAITPDAYEAILRHRKEIVKSAPPRVTEELAQALRGGHSLPTLLLMREVGLLDVLLPELTSVLRILEPDSAHARGPGHLLWALLEVLDAERRRGRSFDDAVLFALLFVPIVRARVREIAPAGEPDPARLATIIEDVVSPLAFRMALPRASTDRIKQALAM